VGIIGIPIVNPVPSGSGQGSNFLSFLLGILQQIINFLLQLLGLGSSSIGGIGTTPIQTATPQPGTPSAPIATSQPALTSTPPVNPATPAGNPNITPKLSGSGPWAGYGFTPSTSSNQQVSGNWTVPTETCGQGDEDIIPWVGYGGALAPSSIDYHIVQTGTTIICNDPYVTTPYSAWYEDYPTPDVSIAYTVKPSDTISATVSYKGNGQYPLTLTDTTQGWSFSITVSDTDSTVLTYGGEIVVENNTAGGVPKFTPIPFSNAFYTDNGVKKPISQMAGFIKFEGNSKMAPSAIDSSGTQFTVSQVGN
jgi:hypothetical protein